MDIIQIRRDTLDNWNLYNPILSLGEIGIITTGNAADSSIQITNPMQFKVGNGQLTWKNLPTYVVSSVDAIATVSGFNVVNTITVKDWTKLLAGSITLEDYIKEKLNSILPVTVDNIADEAVTEDKLSVDLKSKLKDVVKTSEQTLTDSQVATTLTNLKLRDSNGNLFANIDSFNNAISIESAKQPIQCIFGNSSKANKFSGVTTTCVFGNSFNNNSFLSSASFSTFGHNVTNNTFSDFTQNTVGNLVCGNTFNSTVQFSSFGSDVKYNVFDTTLMYSKIEDGLSYVELKAEEGSVLTNIHILSGIHGHSKDDRLVITVPKKYISSSRQLVITTSKGDNSASTMDDIVMYFADEVLGTGGGGTKAYVVTYDSSNSVDSISSTIEIIDNYLADENKTVLLVKPDTKDSLYPVVANVNASKGLTAIYSSVSGDGYTLYVFDRTTGWSKLQIDTVSYGKQQSKSEAQKQQARENIGALASVDGGVSTANIADNAVTETKLSATARVKLNDNVKFTKQNSTEERKAQARENIGALSDAAEAVTESNIATGAVTTSKIIDESVTYPKLSKDLQDKLDKMQNKLFPLTLAVNISKSIAEVGTSTDVTVSWKVKIGEEVVTPDKITINEEEIADKTVTTKKFTEVLNTTSYTVVVEKDGLTKSASVRITFVNPSYTGTAASDVTEITAEMIVSSGTKALKTSKSHSRTFNLNNQKSWYAYPAAYGNLSAIKDSNNFDYIGSYVQSTVVNSTGVKYNVYLLKDATTLDSFVQNYS